MNSPIDAATKITGMMGVPGLEWLYSMAMQMESIVEIGPHKGRSTYVLCAGCRGHVYAVDPFKWSPIPSETDTYDEFMNNMKDFSNFTALRMTSEKAAESVCIPPVVDMVFIDADHQYESVLRDLTLWGPRTRKVLCGHDFTSRIPGVEQALTQYCGMKDVKLAVDYLWYIEKG